jgi:hypothetical protein
VVDTATVVDTAIVVEVVVEVYEPVSPAPVVCVQVGMVPVVDDVVGRMAEEIVVGVVVVSE